MIPRVRSLVVAIWPYLHPSISTALMRPRRPKQYCLQLVIYIYIYDVSRNNDVNITRPAPSEASNVKISRNDNIANYSGQYKGQSHDKTQVRFLRTISVTSMSIHKFNLLQRSNITIISSSSPET